MVIEKISSRVSPVVAITLAAALSVGTILLDIFTPAHFDPSILYVLVLMLVALVRSRRLLWASVIVSIFLTMLGRAVGPLSDPALGHDYRFYLTMNRALVILS